jgi:ubiquinone/menaquinone biosynthesis C-methylase UbiE
VARNKETSMPPKDRPESIENRWDILYRDYPEVYEEFGRIEKQPNAVDYLCGQFPMAGKVVADVAAGTGLSTFKLAQYAAFVIGIEPEEAMRAIATAEQRARGITNVCFEAGTAESLPLADRSVDAVVAVTSANPDVAAFATECERVVRPGGLVLRIDIAPGWYGGELAPVIFDDPSNQPPSELEREAILEQLGYATHDFFMDQDYGTAEKAVRTYGFIFGKRTIDYIRMHNTTTIRWKARIRYKRIV